jgi:hypothetical protein
MAACAARNDSRRRLTRASSRRYLSGDRVQQKTATVNGRSWGKVSSAISMAVFTRTVFVGVI